MSDTYGAWYVLVPLNGSDNLAWALLAIGAYRAGVLGWVPAIGVAQPLRPGTSPGPQGFPTSIRPERSGPNDQATSYRSRFMTLTHAAAKSPANFSFASSLA